MSVKCKNCGYIYVGHENLHGKICTRCNSFIPTDYEMPIIKENKLKELLLFKEALQKIGMQNANID